MYRVCRVDRGFVEVEVVHAPGLSAGQRFRFAPRAVAEMGLVTAPADSQAARETQDSAARDG